jgi:hypothetical protein
MCQPFFCELIIVSKYFTNGMDDKIISCSLPAVIEGGGGGRGVIFLLALLLPAQG